MMNKHDLIVFGRIEACIDGDARYTSMVRVALDAYQGRVIVSRGETVPSGGMDTLGGSLGYAQRFETTVPCDPKAIVSAVRHAFDSTITRYGKPTKHFAWGCSAGATMAGLNRAACERAMFEAMDLADGASR